MHVELRREIKVREYQGLAQQASAMARNTGLEHVRIKYEEAAEVWTKLARNELARTAPANLAQAQPAPRLKAMTNDEKLTAIEKGLKGSYNLAAPRTSDPFVAMAFQHLAAQALGIAKGRGYFSRRVMVDSQVEGLLVTIDECAPGTAPQLAKLEVGRTAAIGSTNA